VEYPESVGNYIPLLQGFISLGILCGPIMGSTLFQLGGFQCPFFVAGSALLFLMLLTVFTVKEGELVDTEDEDETHKFFADANRRAGFLYLLKNFSSKCRPAPGRW